MSLSSVGDVDVHNGGVLCTSGVYNGSNCSLVGETFCGLAYIITRADDLLRVRMTYYACTYSIKRAPFHLRLLYTDMI